MSPFFAQYKYILNRLFYSSLRFLYCGASRVNRLDVDNKDESHKHLNRQRKTRIHRSDKLQFDSEVIDNVIIIIIKQRPHIMVVVGTETIENCLVPVSNFTKIVNINNFNDKSTRRVVHIKFQMINNEGNKLMRVTTSNTIGNVLNT